MGVYDSSPNFRSLPNSGTGKEIMIDPRQRARNIILNNPDLAVDLFDLLVWADQPNLSENTDYDGILDDLFVKIQACRDSRDAYAKTRAAPNEPPSADSVDAIAATGSH